MCRPLQFEVKEVSKKFDKGERQRTRRFVIFYLSRRLRLQCVERVLPRRMRSHLPVRAPLLAVTRLSCRLAEEGYEMGLDLDLNSDLLQLETNDKFVRERERTRTRRTHAPSCCPLVALTQFCPRVPAQTLALASTLALDGSRDSGTFDQSNAPSLLDQYDYGMYGKLYKWKQVRGLPKEPLVAFVAPCA